MTRQEEIKNAIDTIIPISPSRNRRTYEQSMMATGFEAGVKWADEHPKSPWISVKDKMPYEYPELLLNKDTTVPILTKTERLGYLVQYMFYIETRQEWEFTFTEDGGVEYWMPIPKLPKEEEIKL